MKKKIKFLMGFVSIMSVAAWYLYYDTAQAKKDVEPPVIEAGSDEFSVSIGASDAELIAGVTAFDRQDGDVSDSIMIENIKKKNDTSDAFEITYVAFDKSSNMATLTRTLHYSDYRQTHFSLNTPLRFPENQQIDLLSYFTANDCIDGNVTPFITIDGDNDVLEEDPKKGFYECVLSVTNSVGYTTKFAVGVEVFENTYEERTYRPEIALNEYIAYLSVGENLNTNAYLKNVKDGQVKEINFFPQDTSIQNDKRVPVTDIRVNSNVDVNTPGLYSVVYSYTSASTGYECNTTLIVVVE